MPLVKPFGKLFSVAVRVPGNEVELALAALMDFDHAGMIEEDEEGLIRLDVHFTDALEADRCRIAFAAFDATMREIENRNWAGEWQAQWQPLEVGERFYLAPEWIEAEPPPGRVRLEMRPGLVFGGGDHPTTQMCLRLLEHADAQGAAVVDVGTGSGILALGALALGAARATGCDLDPDAVDTAAREGLPVWEGSLDAAAAHSADVILANLPTGVLLGMLPEFARVLAPGGRLVLSGYLEEQTESLDAGCADAGFCWLRRVVKDGWGACLAVRC